MKTARDAIRYRAKACQTEPPSCIPDFFASAARRKAKTGAAQIIADVRVSSIQRPRMVKGIKTLYERKTAQERTIPAGASTKGRRQAR